MAVNSFFCLFVCFRYRIWFCKDFAECLLDTPCLGFFWKNRMLCLVRTRPCTKKRMSVSELLHSLDVQHFEMPSITITRPPLLLPAASQQKVQCVILDDWPGSIYNWWRQTLLRGDSSGLQRLWITHFLSPGYLLTPLPHIMAPFCLHWYHCL